MVTMTLDDDEELCMKTVIRIPTINALKGLFSSTLWDTTVPAVRPVWGARNTQ